MVGAALDFIEKRAPGYLAAPVSPELEFKLRSEFDVEIRPPLFVDSDLQPGTTRIAAATAKDIQLIIAEMFAQPDEILAHRGQVVISEDALRLEDLLKEHLSHRGQESSTLVAEKIKHLLVLDSCLQCFEREVQSHWYVTDVGRLMVDALEANL